MRRLERVFGTLQILPAALLTVPEFCHGAAGAVALSAFIQDHIITQALFAFGGVAAAAIFYYAIRMIVEAYNEKSITDITQSFIYVFIGFVVIAISSAFANSFGLGSIAPGNLAPGLQSVSDFIISGAAGAFTLMVVLAGLRMITSQGEEAEFDKWRKVLIGNCVGVMIMLTAFFVAHAVFDINSGLIVEEMRGIGLFLLTIIGFACIVALIIAGVLLIISIDESLKDRAKRAIIGTLISLLIVMAAYTLIITFVP